MQKTSATQSDYAREIAKIVAAMPLDRAAKVYDFARFILQRPGTQVAVPNADDGWLNDSPEQIAREEAVWQESYKHGSEKLKAMVEEAGNEYAAGTTVPLFAADGEINLPK
ncbi:MAG: hypothetical protein WAU96_03650 [Anaerolineae bacterium]|nr:hypothetical protein [Thermoflexales bacterium]HQW35635.1 hypothetical protein [Thermoflexales bacterium]